jgi:single-strand DNA-binding protein
MRQINTTILVGHMVRDPERKITESGSPLGFFTVASNHRYKDQNGRQKEEVAFVPCVVFGPPAEWLFEHRKGTMVVVNGRLRTETWEGPDGLQSKLVLVAEIVQFVQSIKHRIVESPAPATTDGQNENDDAPPF